MADKTRIEWTDATWNPIVGCTIVSAGCANCYAIDAAARVAACQGPESRYHFLTMVQGNGRRNWTGKVEYFPDRLHQLFSWTRPRRVFLNSLSDLFHPEVRNEWVDQILVAVALNPRHTVQVLTKRPERMVEYFRAPDLYTRWLRAADDLRSRYCCSEIVGISDPARFPRPNLWLGVTVEDQAAADQRIPLLLQTPAKVRFLSCEPLLGPVELWKYDEDEGALRGPGVVISGGMTVGTPHEAPEGYDDSYPGVDWVICGGESGQRARPMHPDWARSLRDQCTDAGVPYFFKQWGAWAPSHPAYGDTDSVVRFDDEPDGLFEYSEEYCLHRSGFLAQRLSENVAITHCQPNPRENPWWMGRCGKHAAGRELDGRTWDEFPTSTPAAGVAS